MMCRACHYTRRPYSWDTLRRVPPSAGPRLQCLRKFSSLYCSRRRRYDGRGRKSSSCTEQSILYILVKQVGRILSKLFGRRDSSISGPLDGCGIRWCSTRQAFLKPSEGRGCRSAEVARSPLAQRMRDRNAWRILGPSSPRLKELAPTRRLPGEDEDLAFGEVPRRWSTRRAEFLGAPYMFGLHDSDSCYHTNFVAVLC